MDTIEQLELQLMLDPDSVATREALIAAYMKQRHYSREQAEAWCLSVWHSYKQAAEAMHAVRLLAPGSLVNHQLMRAIRKAAVVADDEKLKVMICTGDIPPMQVPHLPQWGGEKVDVCCIVGAAWVVEQSKAMPSDTKFPSQRKPPRRRW